TWRCWYRQASILWSIAAVIELRPDHVGVWQWPRTGYHACLASGSGAFGLLAAILILVLWASPASSHNFRGCADPATEPCFANTSTHYFSYNPKASGGRWRAAVEFTRVNSYETTDLTTALAPHEASDVYYYIDNTDRGAYGQYYCLYPEAGGPGVCHHAHIWFNDSYSMTQDQRIRVASR